MWTPAAVLHLQAQTLSYPDLSFLNHIPICLKQYMKWVKQHIRRASGRHADESGKLATSWKVSKLNRPLHQGQGYIIMIKDTAGISSEVSTLGWSWCLAACFVWRVWFNSQTYTSRFEILSLSPADHVRRSPDLFSIILIIIFISHHQSIQPYLFLW